MVFGVEQWRLLVMLQCSDARDFLRLRGAQESKRNCEKFFAHGHRLATHDDGKTRIVLDELGKWRFYRQRSI
jgi:hypothetical protein